MDFLHERINAKKLKNNLSQNLLQKEPLTIVGKKRVEDIIPILERKKKLTSTELSDSTGLSRTRCNEYLKLMERLNIVEPFLDGKKKFYRLKV